MRRGIRKSLEAAEFVVTLTRYPNAIPRIPGKRESVIAGGARPAMAQIAAALRKAFAQQGCSNAA